jgi:uncharacterized membrane protein
MIAGHSDLPMMPAKIATRGGTGGAGARPAVFVAAALAAVFVSGVFLAPALEAAGDRWGGVLRGLYAPVCHQSPERSLHLQDHALAVCSRCTGLYLGAVAGLLLGALLRVGTGREVRPVWLAVAVAPTALDALLPWLGLPQLPAVPRLLLAVPAGAVAGLFLAVGIADLFSGGLPARAAVTSVPHSVSALEEPDG